MCLRIQETGLYWFSSPATVTGIAKRKRPVKKGAGRAIPYKRDGMGTRPKIFLSKSSLVRLKNASRFFKNGTKSVLMLREEIMSRGK
jgi:hypothetical protein